MAKVIGYFDGAYPLRQMRQRVAHAAVFGDYEHRGILERQHSPFDYGTRHLHGLAAVDAATAATYDLSAPGRVSEIKKALRFVANVAASPSVIPWSEQESVTETAWTQLVDDDQWTDVTSDEYAAFLSRWAPRYLCFAVPLYVMQAGQVQPTTNGLMLLDVSFRYQSANAINKGLAMLHPCGLGAAADQRLALFETFLTGTSGGDAINFDPSQYTNVTTVPTVSVQPHPIPPPDVDADLYAKWKSSDDTVASLYDSLAKAPTESVRKTVMDGIHTERTNRDKVAQQIIDKAPPRTGTTTLDCGPNGLFNKDTDRCEPRPTPPGPPNLGPWILAGGVALAFGLLFMSNQRSRR